MAPKKDKIELTKLEKAKRFLKKVIKLRWIGKLFDWFDKTILSKTTRLWMYLLEAAGVIVIFIMIGEFQKGFKMVLEATNEIELKRAQLFIDAVKNSATPIATMVATICGATPVVIGALRSLKTKWSIQDTPVGPVTPVSPVTPSTPVAKKEVVIGKNTMP